MSNIYYLNTKNERVDFIDDFPLLSIDDMFKSSYTNNVKNDVIQEFKQGIMNFTIIGDEPVKSFDKISDVFDYDVIKNVRGRFYIGDYYMLCNITVVSPSKVNLYSNMLKTTLTVTTSTPQWIKEKHYFLNESVIEQSSQAKKYTYSYPFIYSKQKGTILINNDNIIDSDIIIRMFGPATNPFIKIGDMLYQIFVTIDKNEFVEINTIEETIIRYSSFGDKSNVFHYRDKTKSNFFVKIPSGSVQVSWNGKFKAEIIVFEKRSKPRWIG